MFTVLKVTEREEKGVIKPNGLPKSHTCNPELYLWPVHCKYLRLNYHQIAAYGHTTTTIPWFQPLVVGCQSIFIVDIGIKEKYRIQS